MRIFRLKVRIGIIFICLLIATACTPVIDETSQVSSEEIADAPTPTETVEATEIQPTATINNRPQFEGTVAFYSDKAGNPDIYVIQVDGSGLVQLTDDPAFDDSPDL